MRRDMISVDDPRVKEIVKKQKEKSIEKQIPVIEKKKGQPNISDVLYNNMWKDRRCFVIGGGPSLKNFDFSLLENELIIAINRAYEKCESNIIFGADKRFYEWAEAGKFGEQALVKWQNTKAIKIKLSTDRIHIPGVYEINWINQKDMNFNLNDGICFGENSGYAALYLALCLGASPIYLLGFDMSRGWWHEGYPEGQGQGDISTFMRYFEELAPIAKNKATVINLNKKSNLRCFEFGDIKKVLQKKDKIEKNKSWILTTFYTIGTGYAEEVKKLIQSAENNNIKYYAFECQPQGSWRKNLNHKSKCILKAFDMFPDKDIVFVDADAIIHSYPYLFDDLSREREYDMAVCFHVYNESIHGGSLLSGTLWFRNDIRSRELVKLWDNIGNKNPEIRHQHCLRLAIEQSGIDGNYIWLYRLPKEYTRIYDYNYNRQVIPIIEHFQASRRLRKEVGDEILYDSNFRALAKRHVL